MIEERMGEAFEFDERLTVVGNKLKPGDTAPDFELDYFDPVQETMQVVRLSDSAGAVRLIRTTNSLDALVCHSETHQFEALRAEMSPGVYVYTVSTVWTSPSRRPPASDRERCARILILAP